MGLENARSTRHFPLAGAVSPTDGIEITDTDSKSQVRRNEQALHSHGGIGRIVSAIAQLGMTQIVVALGLLARNKMMAIYLKPDGFGEFTQMVSIATPIYVLTQFGMAVGLSRNTASANDSTQRQDQLATANSLTGVITLAVLSVIVPLLMTPAGTQLIAALGVTPTFQNKLILLVLFAIAPIEIFRNNYMSFLQGLVDIKGLSTKRTIAVMISTALVFPLVAVFRFGGLVLQMMTASLVLAGLLGARCRDLGFRPLAFAWNSSTATALAGFGTASLLSGFALNSTEAVIRGHLISGASVAENGIYQAALSLSTQVTTVIVGSVGAYSLATLSQVKDAKDISSGMEQLLHVVLPLSTLSLGFVGILGRPLFSSLFSSQFLEGTKFLPLLLTANYVQTAAWVTGAPLLGRALLRTWLVIQLIGVSIRYAAVDLWFPMIGSYAVPAALLAAWGFDLMANLLVCKWVIRAGLQLSTLLTFCAGAGVVAAAAVLGTTTTHFGTCLLGAAVLCCIAGLMSWSETAAGLRKLLPWTPQ